MVKFPAMSPSSHSGFHAPPPPPSPPTLPAPPSNPMDASQEVPLKAQVPPLLLVGAFYWWLRGGAEPRAALRGWGWVPGRLGPRPLCSRCGGRWRPGWEVCARVCRAVGSCGSHRPLSASSAQRRDGWRRRAGPAPWGRPRVSPSPPPASMSPPACEVAFASSVRASASCSRRRCLELWPPDPRP